MTKKNPRTIFNFKCPFCESDKLHFHQNGDYVDIKNEEFFKKVTCQFCGNKFSINGYINKEPLFLRE